MILKCLILDDEPLAHKVIIEYAKEIPYLDIVAQAYLPMNAVQVLKQKSIDLLFLDIQMPQLNGLEMLRLIDQPPQVIVTSAFKEYALEGFDLQVCDYLLKPFRFERFLQATEKAFDHQSRLNNSEDTNKNYLLIKSDKRLIQIQKEEVVYIESYGNFVKIWTMDQCLITARTLNSFVEELHGSGFCQVHKSYLVSKKYVEYIEGNSVMMKLNSLLPISKNYKSDFLDFIKGLY
jgi:DNA-binding LytR/AlgR family response regulator